ncbi:MAG: hypothetical protein ACKPKO_03180, partial [Candidatus Fonsibacter sp.]
RINIACCLYVSANSKPSLRILCFNREDETQRPSWQFEYKFCLYIKAHIHVCLQLMMHVGEILRVGPALIDHSANLYIDSANAYNTILLFTHK